MYNVISGLRRSGTSLLMLALRQSGIPAIGFRYSMDKMPPEQKTIDGNPNGYWEVGKVNTEIGLPEDADWLGMEGDIIKVMAECLYKSDPSKIIKTVMIFREPGRVVHSLLKHNYIDELKIWIVQSLFDVGDSLDFLKTNNIPTKIVIYEDILKNPLQEMTAICEFIGRGDPEIAASWVKQSLSRTTKKSYPNIKLMKKVYKYAKIGDIDAIIDFKKELKEEGSKLLTKYDKKNG